MNEKQIDFNEATGVWWFVTWRTALTLIVLNIVLAIAGKYAPVLVELAIIGWVSIILSVVVSVYYFKLAINRNYKTFRLSASPLAAANEVEQQV